MTVDDNNMSERLEGLEAIRTYIDPHMTRRTFYRYHRGPLGPYLFERKNWWKRKDRHGHPLKRYFTFKNLVQIYMIRRRII